MQNNVKCDFSVLTVELTPAVNEYERYYKNLGNASSYLCETHPNIYAMCVIPCGFIICCVQTVIYEQITSILYRKHRIIDLSIGNLAPAVFM